MMFYALLPILVSAWRINRDDQFIVDDDGLRRVFHGVNVIYKIAPFYPPVLDGFDSNNSLSEFDMDNLLSWGMNFIRLYVSWEGVEPVKGQYNATYLQQIANIVRMAEKKGITVLLDAHQDVLSRFFCGEGIPDWAISRTPYKFPFPIQNVEIRYDDKGVPLLEDCLKTKFVMYYFTFDVSQTFQDLFDNKDGIADSFAQFWGYVANYFKDFPNVIGYEIINEPLPGSPYKSLIEFIYPNVGNNVNLLPLYKRVSAEIRKYDKLKLVFFESGISDYFGGQFADSPGGEEFRDREVLSYHIYCQLVDDLSVPTDEKACGVLDTYMYNAKEGAAKALKIGKFMTEFGAIVDSPDGIKEINFLLQLMEYQFTSWAYWEFKYYADVTTQANPGQIESFYDLNGQLYTNKVKALARPYATMICGQPELSYFEPQDGSHEFILKWKISHKCRGKLTQIFLSREFYYAKYTATFRGCAGCSIQEKKRSYFDVYVPLTVAEGTLVTLTVKESK